MKSAVDLIAKDPKKYKYSSHNIDIGKWTTKNNKKYNKVLPTLLFHLRPVYLNNLIKSEKKLNYLTMGNLLIREFINQKF